MNWDLLVGPVAAIAGLVVGQLIGARRERDAARREWSRSLLADGIDAVGAMVDHSRMDPRVFGLIGSDEVARERFDEIGEEFLDMKRSLRSLVLHPDDDVRAAAIAAIPTIVPAFNHAFSFRFHDLGSVASAALDEKWQEFTDAADRLAAAVRCAGWGE